MTAEENPAAPVVDPTKQKQGIQRFALGVVWQVGLLLGGVIGGSFVIGLLLDRWLGTRATFLVIALMLSIPLNLIAVYVYGRRKVDSVVQRNSSR